MKLVRLALLILPFFAVNAHAAGVLGTASTFAVLAASTATNTGATVLYGDLGLYPGTSITGFPPGIVNDGVIHTTDAVALQAQADALTAYNYLASLPPNQNLTGQDLGGLTLTPGVYKFDSSAQLTGTLTLDFQGLSNVMVVIQIGSTLTTASASSVVEINPGQNDQVFFQVGSSATLGTTTAFQGHIIALASITLNNSATIKCGSALALNGAVTMDTNVINEFAGAVDFSNYHGTLTGTTAGLTLKGSTLFSVAGYAGGGAIIGANLGSVAFTTGALTSGSLAAGGTFAAGGSFTIVTNGTGGLPNGPIFTGSFDGPVTWTLLTLADGTHIYTLSGTESGTWVTGATVTGVSVQLTVSTGKGFYKGSTRISSGDTEITGVPCN